MSYIIRIDDRLVHGQVVEGWIKALGFDSIVVCADEVYCDELSRQLFEISVPRHIKFLCYSVELTADSILKSVYDKMNSLILLGSLKDLKQLVKFVKEKLPTYTFPPVNIGGIRYVPGRKQIYKALFLSKEDLNIIKEIVSFGLKLEYYVLPRDEKIPLNDKIAEIEEIIEEKET
ncbi:MAG: PTS sugar transporter subunit IIB [Endomicrobia bacterium]|nr:PTS sugar transporter subunit IIB [Endomicrobiia bacterium]MDW8055227.1 PTS sugar transporter subunit IIB [Elusimicrobiota bacterium]